jgi:hypothetical protein
MRQEDNGSRCHETIGQGFDHVRCSTLELADFPIERFIARLSSETPSSPLATERLFRDVKQRRMAGGLRRKLGETLVAELRGEWLAVDSAKYDCNT